MIKTIIIDDEPLARSLVKEYLEDYPQITVIRECGDGFEGIKAVNHFHPDLLFLDIQMPKLNGFEMLELIEPAPPVIFTTAFDHFATKAFEENAVDYLLKPFSKERFDKAVQKWLLNYQNGKPLMNPAEMLNKIIKQPEEEHRIVVKEGSNIKIIPAKEIFYLEAYDDYVKIFIRDDCFLKKKTMNYFESSLQNAGFIRVHRSYLLQVQFITRIEPYEKNNYVAVLKNGQKIPLSRNGYTKLKQLFGI